MRKFIIAVTASVFALAGTAACNTVSGAGEDLQSISDDVQEEI
jgi:predicted small secreted protein